jgi:hypothetical protein
MITCHVCGAQNDPGNRFCDQCGARLDAATAESEHVSEPQAAAPVILDCAVCGAQVLPGQAFCDNCGADLVSNPPVDTSAPAAAPSDEVPDMDETMMAPPTDVPLPVSEPHPLPGVDEPSAVPPPDTPPSAPAEPPAPAPAPDMDETLLSPPPDTPPSAPAEPPAPAPAPDMDETVISSPPPPSTLDIDETPAALPSEMPPANEEAAVTTPSADAAMDMERQKLEEQIEQHRATITQLEQIVNPMPAGAAPEYLLIALDNARQELARAESDLAALPTGPDPAEVARLEEELSRHRATIEKLEQVLQVYPAGAAPAYLVDALDNARHSLAQAESDLDTLTQGGAPRAPAAPPPAAPTAPAEEPGPVTPPEPPAPTPAAAPEATAFPESVDPSDETVLSPPPMSFEAPPAPAQGPRLQIVDGEQELPLPVDTAEIIVGREDPVSHIFPEVDLTPFGGEAGGVSRQHARISFQNGQWSVADLNSTNYTHLDGKRLEPNVPFPLHDGAQVRFGRIATIFKL